MKRITLLLTLPLFLVACGGQTAVSYKLAFPGVSDPASQQELAGIAMMVIERRLDNMETAPVDQEIETATGGIVAHVTVKNAEIAGALTSQLVAPFTFRLMKSVPEGQGTIDVEGHGSFAETGITEADVIRGESSSDAQGKGAVRITFTPNGAAKLRDVMKANFGKDIGIFVRNRLISKLTVQGEQTDDNIIIRNIPNPDLAAVFVDDLNVGLHVTFTPLP